MQAYFYPFYEILGIFVPLIVVNCIILGRAESFASKNPIIYSLADGLGIGLGFTLSLTILGGIREIIGNGTIFGANFIMSWWPTFEPLRFMVKAPGAFVALGLLLGFMNLISRKGPAH
jgi:electron transport complex protein RnfE